MKISLKFLATEYIVARNTFRGAPNASTPNIDRENIRTGSEVYVVTTG